MADYAFVVIEITPHFIQGLYDKKGKVLMCTDTRGEKFLNRCTSGEIVNIDTQKVDSALKRSHEQLGLYWAACTMVADNTEDYNWNTPEKVDLQCKIAARLIKGFLSYTDHEGIERIQLMTGSISFKELKHLDACNYFDQAFKAMAEHLNITIEDLIKETQKRMVGND